MNEDQPARSKLPPLWVVALSAAYVALTAAAGVGVFVKIDPERAPGAAAFWLNRAYGWWAAITFVAFQAGIGRVLLGLRRLRDCREDGLAGWLICITVGSFASYALLAVLSLVNVLGSFGVPAYRLEPPAPRRRWAGYLAAVLAVAWAAPYLAQTFLPDTDWDGAMYHLPLAERLLRDGLWATEPTFPGFDLPGAINLFYACLLKVRAESAIIPLNFLTSCGVALAAYALCARLWSRRAGLWAAGICLATNIIWELGLDPRVDGVLAFYCAVALLAFLLWLRRRERPGLLVLAGMAMGVAIGAKYTALLMLALLGTGAIVLSLRRGRRRVPGTVTALALAAGAALLPSGLWYVRNAVRLANPVYPLALDRVYHDERGRAVRFRPALERLLARTLPAERLAILGQEEILGIDLARATEAKRRGNLLRIWDVILHPSRYARKPCHWMSPLLLLFVLLPVFRRDVPARWLYGVGMAAFAVMAAISPLLRYAVFVMPPLAAGAGMVLAAVRWRAAAAAVALAVLAQLGYNSACEWRKLLAARPAGLMAGKVSRLHWVEQVGYNGAVDMVRLSGHINERIRTGTLSEQTILFMVGEGKGLHLLCGFVPDSSREGYPWLVELIKAQGDLDRLAESFRQHHVKYVIFNQGYLDWCLENARIRRDELTFSLYTLRQFLNRHTRGVSREGGILVFQVLPRPGRPPLSP